MTYSQDAGDPDPDPSAPVDPVDPVDPEDPMLPQHLSSSEELTKVFRNKLKL